MDALHTEFRKLIVILRNYRVRRIVISRIPETNPVPSTDVFPCLELLVEIFMYLFDTRSTSATIGFRKPYTELGRHLSLGDLDVGIYHQLVVDKLCDVVLTLSVFHARVVDNLTRIYATVCYQHNINQHRHENLAPFGKLFLQRGILLELVRFIGVIRYGIVCE